MTTVRKRRRVATWQQLRKRYLIIAWLNVIFSSLMLVTLNPIGLLNVPFAWYFFAQARAELEVKCPYQYYYDRAHGFEVNDRDSY